MRACASTGLRLRASALGAGAVILGVVMSGCHANYAVDVRNMTPQPLFVQVMETGTANRLDRRLGPGDRLYIGPVRAKEGYASVTFDTLPNPQSPVTLPLRPGTNTYNVRQRGDGAAGTLEVEELVP